MRRPGLRMLVSGFLAAAMVQGPLRAADLAESRLLAEDVVELPREPRRIHSVEPAYPPEAAQSEDEGDVSFDCTVDSSGRVVALRAQLTHDLFTPAAAAAVRQWRYEPARDPRPRSFPVVVRFRLPHKAIHHLPAATLLERYRSGDRRSSTEAFRELVDRGLDLLPQLVDELRTTEVERRCATLHFLSRLGPEARVALPLLLELFDQEAAGSPHAGCAEIGDALARIDPAIFAGVLRDAVRDRNVAACRLLLATARFDGKLPEPVFDALELEGCREAASLVLREAGDPAALPLILRAASSPSAVVRRRAAQAFARVLQEVKPDERRSRVPEVVPALVRALSDPDPEVREGAARALTIVGPDGAAAVPALAVALEESHPGVRRRSAQALGAMGMKARAAGPALLRALAAATMSGAGDNSGLHMDLKRAIAATGAGRSDAQLAAEDEMRAVVVAYLVEGWRRSEVKQRQFTLSVMGGPPSAALVRELARRGLAPVANDDQRSTHIGFGEVAWTAGDMATVHLSIRGDVDSSGRAHVVAFTEGRWTVVGGRGWT